MNLAVIVFFKPYNLPFVMFLLCTRAKKTFRQIICKIILNDNQQSANLIATHQLYLNLNFISLALGSFFVFWLLVLDW
jgi:hypothetical protein